jgi:hypothetical protein
MNYRKGFLRFYGVVAACWIALWLYVGFSKMRQQRTVVPTRLSRQIDEARKNGYRDDDVLNYLQSKRKDLGPRIQELKQNGHSPTDILALLDIATVSDLLEDRRFQALNRESRRSVLIRLDPRFASLPSQEQDKVLDLRPAQTETVEVGPGSIQRDPATGEWFVNQRDYSELAFNAELAFIPPAVGYVALFLVLPWIGRGFTSSK